MVLCAIILFLVMDLFSIGSGYAVASTICWGYFAYEIHGQVLLGDRWLPMKGTQNLVRFMWRTIGLGTLVAVFGMVPAAILTPWSNESGPAIRIFILLALLFCGIVGLIVYGLLGTWLPAQITGKNNSLSDAIQRGKKTFWAIVWRLVAGAGVMLLIYFISIVALAALIVERLFFMGLDIGAIVLSVVSTLLVAYVTSLVAITFSRAYLSLEKTVEE